MNHFGKASGIFLIDEPRQKKGGKQKPLNASRPNRARGHDSIPLGRLPVALARAAARAEIVTLMVLHNHLFSCHMSRNG